MVNPASLADWAQASLVAAPVGGLAAACEWALREEQHALLVTARSATPVPTASTGQHSNAAELPAEAIR
jgi:hypothetical protein